MQSVTHSRPPRFYRWHDEALTLRAVRPSSAPSGAAQAPERRKPRGAVVGWCEAHITLLTRLGLIGLFLFYAATAAYGVTLSGRWEEVRRGALDIANGVAVMAGLSVGRVAVEGNKHLTEAQVVEALGVGPGVSIFAFDTAAARDRLLKNGWVREARVMRLLPSTLVVELEERSPFAVWRDGGESAVIDTAGSVLSEVQPASFPSLPTVSGPGAASPAKEIVDMVRSFPELAAHVRDMERIAGRRWDVLLDTGLRAKLPAGQMRAALAELNDIVARNPAVLYEISEIDLRVDSQFTLRLKDSSEDGRKKFLSWFAKARASREAL